MAADLRSQPTLLAVAASLLISGCAVNPMVQRPVAAPAADASDLDMAIAEAVALREKFEERLNKQVSDQVSVNNLLFGLGVATFGLAAGGAHRDTYLVTSLAGGATYAYSSSSLQGASNLNAYQVGIGRFNCAIAIARSQRVDKSILVTQSSDATTLGKELEDMTTKMTKLQSKLILQTTLPEGVRSSITDQVKAAQSVYGKAMQVYQEAEDLQTKNHRLAPLLRGTADQIFQAVNEMVQRNVAEPAAVLAALKTLSDSVGNFGSSVGVTIPVPVAATRSGTGNAAQADNKLSNANLDTDAASGLEAAMVDLAVVQTKVESLSNRMATRAARYAQEASTEEWSKCVPNYMSLSNSEFNFTANASEDQSQTFRVTGGTPKFVGGFTSLPSFGVSVDNPGGQGTFTVTVPKTVKGPHELRYEVEDSSTPPQRKSIAIRVASATTTTAPKAPDESQSDSGQSQSLVAALTGARNQGTAFTVGTEPTLITLTVQSFATDKSGTRVQLDCRRNSTAARFNQTQVRNALLLHLLTQHGLSAAEGKTLNGQGSKLKVYDSIGCVK